jgi:BirA family biotin operon repressor/biotin-[acetyl-CoA-carboxylase] ligase
VRDAYLRREGFRVLRFWNNDVLKNTQGVLEVILGELETPSPGSPRSSRGSPPSPASGREERGA